MKILYAMCVVMVMLSGCGYKEYVDAVKSQNLELYERQRADDLIHETRDREYRMNMMGVVTNATLAAANTENTSDDVFVPMMVGVMLDKYQTVDTIRSITTRRYQPMPIQAPESPGEFLQKATGIVGVGAAVAMGIVQSNNATDVAVAGINGAGNRYTTSDGSTVYQNSFQSGENSEGGLSYTAVPEVPAAPVAPK